MTNRLVTENKISFSGNIIALCNPYESWSPRYKYDAIRDIENKLHNYFMMVNGKNVDLKVAVINGHKHLVYDEDKA
jgi:hypothetical protein